MGDWGPRAWENDEAADWFQEFWKDGWALVQKEIEEFDPTEEQYDSLRAAAYVLAAFGGSYLAPVAYLDKLRGWLVKTQEILGNMIDPPSEEWGFLDMWGNDPDVVTSVKDQIEALRTRRAELPD